MKCIKKIILLTLLAMAVGVSIFRITVSTALVTSGMQVTALQSEQQAVQHENMKLEQRYYTMSSLTTIDQEAIAQGFVEEKHSINLGSPVSVAFRQ